MSKITNCGVCGQLIEVHYGDEETGCYIPREAEALRAKLEIAVKALEDAKSALLPWFNASNSDVVSAINQIDQAKMIITERNE